MSAANRAAALGLSHVLLEKTDHLSDTIYRYQKGKHVMATPVSLTLRSDCTFDAGKREAILENWNQQTATAKANVRYKAEVKSVDAREKAFKTDFDTVKGDVLNIVPPMRAGDRNRGAYSNHFGGASSGRSIAATIDRW